MHNTVLASKDLCFCYAKLRNNNVCFLVLCWTANCFIVAYRNYNLKVNQKNKWSYFIEIVNHHIYVFQHFCGKHPGPDMYKTESHANML